ncbi:MAG: hypothetical protein EYC69_09200 [Bacteroidetes bacterium]|nr:MAG: hypothetical protein EYC69_09200 [Bacteroidota bacterium]
MEDKLGLKLSSILIGLILLGLAALFTSPRWELFFHGKGFSRLSLAPFDLSVESSLRYRILSPLLGYLLFLKGALFKYFMLAALAIFHMLVYFFHRRKGFSPLESLGIGMLLSLSTLSFFQLYFPGYTDPVSYILLLILLFNRERNVLVMTCLALMIFNHDNTVFLFPFLYLFLLGNDFSFQRLAKTFLLFIPAIILYATYRFVLGSITEVGFDTGYYFSQENLRWTWDHVSEHLAEGIFQAFRMGWILPLVALLINIRDKRYYEIVLILTCFFFVASQFFIAYDISRLSGLAFPLIILSGWRFKESLSPRTFRGLLWAAVIINLFVPSLCVGALEPTPYPPFWWPELKEWIFSN